MSLPRVFDAHAAIAGIADGATVAIHGAGGGVCEPDELVSALGRRFEQTGHPRDLTLVYSLGLGDRTDRGLHVLARSGLIRRLIAGHLGMSPAIGKLVQANEIEAYNLPMGVISLLYREIAAGRPGLVTPVGTGTFVDPRFGGGRLTPRTTQEIVRLITIDDREYLFYPSFPIDVALIRASTADRHGNLSLADETSYLDALELAAAARASRGLIIAQVRQRTTDRTHPKAVHVPGILVDRIVENPHQWQTYQDRLNEEYAGHTLDSSDREVTALPLDARTVIARRASREVSAGDICNVGLGIPDAVPTVLRERGLDQQVITTVEHGIIGGTTARGHVFGATVGHHAVIPMPSMVDLYHGGLLDLAFLGFGQVDGEGDVNVGRFGDGVAGVGGFVDISQSAGRIVFCGTFTAGGLSVDHSDGRAAIVREGRTKKFVPRVEQISFNGRRALAEGQSVLLVTERAVLRLEQRGLRVIEVAPGIDVRRDIVDQSGAELIIERFAEMTWA
jgi:acyl CoA:acetate/3-ketoacid CoA transferase